MTVRVMRKSGDARVPFALLTGGRHRSDLSPGDSVDVNFEELDRTHRLTVRTERHEANIDVVDPGPARLLGIRVRLTGWRRLEKARDPLRLEVIWVADDPAELTGLLATDPDAAAGWEAAPGYVKHVYTDWIRKPRRVSTRQSRAAQTASWASDGVLESRIQHPTIGDVASVFSPI